ncbi:hypothetical protein M1137_02500 [Candidatus Parvarchaeota archaeon]|jgi:hypothetical protein|nr:hypothetical protein [Candidatus Parvarchaeota archaeon]
MENEILARFLQELDREGYNECTKKWYFTVIHRFQDVIKPDISLVTSEDVDRFFEYIRTNDFVFETKKHYLSRFRKFSL